MNANEIKQKLHNYRYIEFKIDAINEEIKNLISLIDVQRNVKSPILTGMPSSNNISDPVAQAAERINDIYKNEYARLEFELDKLFKEKHQVDEFIEILNNTERQIIELKYFKKYKWWMVVNTINYSEKQCRRICNQAIYKIHDSFNK